MRNPKWTREEMILVLNLYFKLEGESISSKHPEVIELSNIIKRLDLHPKRSKVDKFRNPNAIALRLSNYKSVDPMYSGTGLKNGGKHVKEIWDEFVDKKSELSKIADMIIESSNIFNDINYYEDNDIFFEGKVIQRIHFSRERNKKIVEKKKKIALDNNELVCSACGFDFYKTYGELGNGFIECHHDYPISLYHEESNTKLDDLKLLCSNCHSIIHRRRPWLTVQELKEIIIKNKI